ncbi:NADPH-dependent F420 reductase [Nocardioides marmorisolisilvae]|uniref:NADP oxidoreductase n=1 Tax=Nocardioides marmorisolisilvae TaxID=1542737 RepID=A0A3N0DII1_9ACTN|nr:NAD(P)-binding domain-containing protein [Nocardioides marmorisolisilvae]RNL75498.1 NADP oxidoreductase [Nocardioides marmorisolisilvae]
MKIAVIGTGSVGRTLTDGFRRIGHDVVIGTRDVAETRGRAEWADEAALVPFAEAGDGADLVVNATGGNVSADALAHVDLDGKVLLDVANPLDFSNGFPPTLTVKDTDSLAEQLQRAFPTARVVKSLNTVNAAVMVEPAKLPGESTMFLAGDDAEARALVRGLLTDLGWADVVEFPSLDAARGLEMWLPLWVRLMGNLGTADFNLKLVR